MLHPPSYPSITLSFISIMSYILNTKDASEYSPKGLPLPVVIPQQRPGSKERGFIAAYAPSLEHCGIDQSTFLHFVDDCNKALLGNKWLGAVQVVSLGVAFTPELIVMGVATAIQAGATIANRSHVKSKFVPSTLGSQGHAIDVATNRTNSVIDRYNNQLFRPNGLFCMIVNYDPQQKAECRQSSPRPYQRPLPIGPLTRLSGRFQHPTVGCPEDPQKLPTEVAPLRYIDDRRHFKEMMGQGEPKCQSQEGKKSGRQRVKDALAAYNDYLDRRARARYVCYSSPLPLHHRGESADPGQRPLRMKET